MPENTTTEEASQQQTEASPAEIPQEGAEEQKTFDAAYVKKLRDEAAKHRTEAKANAEAAKRLAEIEEAQKTEAQKQADRVAALERDAQTAKAEALRYKIAAKHNVSDEDAELFLTGTDEETLTKQAERLAARTADAAAEAGKPRAPQPDKNQGKTPGAPALNSPGLEQALRNKLGIP